MKATRRFFKLFHVKLFTFFFILSINFASAQKIGTVSLNVKALPEFVKNDTSVINVLKPYKSLENSSVAYDWFYWTNFARQHPKVFWEDVVSKILDIYPQLNTSYAKSLKRELFAVGSLPPIRYNPSLSTVATAHAVDLIKNKKSTISHFSSNGDSFEKRVFASGIKSCAAENISSGSSNAVMALVFLFLDGGLEDLGHRKNLLNPYYVEMGIGVSQKPNNEVIVVQDFACDQTK